MEKANKLLPIIGISIFIYLLFSVDIYKVFSTIIAINLSYLIFLPLLTALILTLQTFKWSIILKKQQITIKFWDIFRINLIGFSYATITPAKIGGLIKIEHLRNTQQCSLAKSTSSVIIDKLLDLFSILLFSICGAFIIIEKNTPLFISLIIIKS